MAEYKSLISEAGYQMDLFLTREFKTGLHVLNTLPISDYYMYYEIAYKQKKEEIEEQEKQQKQAIQKAKSEAKRHNKH